MQIYYTSARQLSDFRTNPLRVEGTLVVMPFTNPQHAERTATILAQRSGAPGCVVAILDDQGIGFVQMVNTMFRHSQSEFFAYVAQDAFPGRAWLQLALQALGATQGSFLGFNDGKWAGAIASFGLARRSWAEKNYAGDFFNPQYLRHYADVELTILALQAGLYRYEANSVVVEVDWAKDQAPIHEADRQLFLARQQQGFDSRVTNPALLKMIAE